MAYHVFISYAREDSQFCEQLYDTLSRVLDLEVYRDVERAYAGIFSQHIRDALTEQPAPSLFVLASQSAVESKWVRRELDTFIENTRGGQDTPILTIQLTPGAAEAMGIEKFQMIDLSEIGPAIDEALVDRLWLALSGRIVSQRLSGNRDRAAAWCAQQLPSGRPDFWGDGWRDHVVPLLDPTGVASCALTADAGSGKSVIAAHYVREILDGDLKNMPVLITEPDAIEAGAVAATVCGLVGVPSLGVLSAHAYRLSRRGYRVVFVVDGLDRIGRDPEIHREFVAALQQMASATTLLVTCRSGVWADEFAGLGIDEMQLGALDPLQVDRVLQQYTRFRSPSTPEILKIPFFLDAVLQAQDQMLDLADNETDILASLWRRYTRPVQGAIPELSSPARVLHHLAMLQLNTMTYSVRMDRLEESLQAGGGDEHMTVAQLRSRGIAVQSTVGRQPMIRLRHDLLDCFGIMHLLLDDSEGPSRRRVVYERAADDIGWSLLAAMVQLANDRHLDVLLREVFCALLEMLDKKCLGAAHMARAWAATYVLRSKFSALLPLIIECLGGDPVPSLTSSEQPAVSCPMPGARVTREAASSLASAFSVIDDWSRAEPDSAIPVLVMNLAKDRWPRFRRRFVEALANYRRRDAVSALKSFAEVEIRKASSVRCDADLDIFADIADALGKTGSRDSSVPLLDSIIATSQELMATLSAEPASRHLRVAAARAERAAVHARQNLLGGISDVIELSLVSDDELLESLKPQELVDRASAPIYTDWRTVQWAADQARRRARGGGLTPRLRDSVIEALNHDLTRARGAAVECLAWVDHPEAREAILAELMEPSVPAEVRRECLAALRIQLSAATTPALRAARRWTVQAAARRAAEASAFTVADDLNDVLNDPLYRGDFIVSGGAFEFDRAVGRDMVLRTTFVNQPDTDSSARQLIASQDKRAVGAGLENKYRLYGLKHNESGVLTIELAESTWREGAGFHRAMRRWAQIAPEKVDDLLSKWLSGSSKLPGLASVHCLLLTSDSKIVLGRRGSGTPYAPDRWSPTFEEQLADVDLATTDRDAFSAAATRGLEEELGGSSASVELSYLGTVMEMPILSPAVVMLLTTSDTFADVAGRWETTRRVSGQPSEIVELAGVESSACASAQRDYDMHPTGPIRLEMQARRG